MEKLIIIMTFVRSDLSEIRKIKKKDYGNKLNLQCILICIYLIKCI